MGEAAGRGGATPLAPSRDKGNREQRTLVKPRYGPRSLSVHTAWGKLQGWQKEQRRGARRYLGTHFSGSGR